MLFFFFFQAEDGIRDTSVTGVQTCALPIFQRESNMARFTANPERFDPYKNFKFRVRWDGRYVAGVSKVSALKRSTEVVEHRSEEHTSELQSPMYLVCRLLLEKKKQPNAGNR